MSSGKFFKHPGQACAQPIYRFDSQVFSGAFIEKKFEIRLDVLFRFPAAEQHRHLRKRVQDQRDICVKLGSRLQAVENPYQTLEQFGVFVRNILKGQFASLGEQPRHFPAAGKLPEGSAVVFSGSSKYPSWFSVRPCSSLWFQSLKMEWMADFKTMADKKESPVWGGLEILCSRETI